MTSKKQDTKHLLEVQVCTAYMNTYNSITCEIKHKLSNSIKESTNIPVLLLNKTLKTQDGQVIKLPNGEFPFEKYKSKQKHSFQHYL